ncbi:PleD family two-component system response regulator [Parasediminibacterium paludis]|uniref:PleD family two-component system response regulator n=1 Tax=Parasediminibacterium paludis TaxID=908966 RepID=A0ABV8Q0D1_9BACT
MMGELNTEKANVLIVEDDSFSQTILNMFLKQQYCTAVADNGSEALNILQSGFMPQLIISDLHTPELDGFQLLEILKANPLYQAIPFVVLCGDDSEVQKIRCTKAGAAAFVVKPFNPTVLASLIDTLLKKN